MLELAMPGYHSRSFRNDNYPYIWIFVSRARYRLFANRACRYSAQQHIIDLLCTSFTVCRNLPYIEVRIVQTWAFMIFKLEMLLTIQLGVRSIADRRSSRQ